MMKINKLIISLFLPVVILMSFSTLGGVVFAGDVVSAPHSTVLPPTEYTVMDCERLMSEVNRNYKDAKKTIKDRESGFQIGDTIYPDSYTDILACAIKTGDIKMWMIPYYIRYILEFVIGLAGLVAVGAVVFGGYLYLFGGISSDKDKGKNAIKNGLIGLVLIFSAWGLVNVLIALVTG